MRPAAALCLFVSGCFGGCDDGLPTPLRDLAVADRAVPDLAARDLGASPVDAAPADLAASVDAPRPVDLASDLSGPCQGGYLNSDAGNACPLACGAGVRAVPDEGRNHVPFGTSVTYPDNPPASGPHWPSPASWGIHDEVLQREWWVHNLEHGGVVLLYNCPQSADLAGGAPDASPPPPNACPTEIGKLKQIYAQHPPDNWFNDQLIETRIIVTPDPLLPKRFAAVAWDWAWLGDTLDANAVQCFVDARYGRGPEDAP